MSIHGKVKIFLKVTYIHGKIKIFLKVTYIHEFTDTYV